MPNSINDINFIRQTQHIQNRQPAAKTLDDEQLEKTCRDFESLFVSYMMQQMRQTIPEDGIIGRSQAEKIYTGMLDNEIAKTVSHNQGIGLARVMYEQMAAIRDDVSKNK
ncbi:MAG: rod-binding protein [Desulfobacteraceae bacterium]|jgi:flagellar protein FlgJ